MSRVQLDDLRRKVGANTNLEQNGRLLHMRDPLGGFYEWIVLTYNFQILGDFAKENVELRKKYQKLLENYYNMKMTMNQGTVPGPADPAGASKNPANMNQNAMVFMLNQKIDDMEKRFDKLEELIKNKY